MKTENIKQLRQSFSIDLLNLDNLMQFIVATSMSKQIVVVVLNKLLPSGLERTAVCCNFGVGSVQRSNFIKLPSLLLENISRTSFPSKTLNATIGKSCAF